MAQPKPVDLSSRSLRKRGISSDFYEAGPPTKTASRQAGKPARKATYKLPDPLLDQIEDLYIELRRDRRGQRPIDKAVIVAEALRRGLEDASGLKKALGA
jgi:hypothetical protein